jgi:hypothetical protein
MGYLNHVRACNAHDLSGFRPFRVEGARVGWVRHGLAERLVQSDEVFHVSADSVDLVDRLGAPERRTAAVARVVEHLAAEGTIEPLRGEPYPVLTAWGKPALLCIDRAAVATFGIAAYGLHVNGFVRRPEGLSMWIGRRAADRAIAPGKLDNLIAGGQPAGLTLTENLIKESAEEASIGADLARRAVPVGALTYRMETREGLKPDTLFLYDLELPESFVPRNTDGEVSSFDLWPLARVADTVRDSDDFKFNCSLVVIDFLIRHGFLTPDEPDYLDLVKGLHR